jgi:hypothetical protein
METRELYKQKYEAQLKEWGAKVETIHARAQKMAAQSQIDLKPHLEHARVMFDAARSKVGHMAKATDDAWDGVRHDADTAWQELRSSVKGAFAALRTHRAPDVETKPPA